MIIAYFGDEYSHTYMAAKRLADSGHVPYHSIASALYAVKNGQANYAVVPIENSIEGTVTESLDTIAASCLYIVKELIMPISHTLIALKGSAMQGIKTVYSHSQALSQCRNFINDNLTADTNAVAYTSYGVKMLTDNTKAVIGAKIIAENNLSLQVLASDIQDYKNNCTRFVLVASKPVQNGNKASVMFTTPDKAGALCDTLEVFKNNNINLSKIESRPNRDRIGGYNFFADFTVKDKSQLTKLLELINEKVSELKLLGIY